MFRLLTQHIKTPAKKSQSNNLSNTIEVWRILLHQMICSHTKSNHLGLLHIINYNFVPTQWILAESYSLDLK